MDNMEVIVQKLDALGFKQFPVDTDKWAYYPTSDENGITVFEDGRIYRNGRFLSAESLFSAIKRKDFLPKSDKVFDCHYSSSTNSTQFSNCCGTAVSKGATICCGCGSKIRTWL